MGFCECLLTLSQRRKKEMNLAVGRVHSQGKTGKTVVVELNNGFPSKPEQPGLSCSIRLEVELNLHFCIIIFPPPLGAYLLAEGMEHPFKFCVR